MVGIQSQSTAVGRQVQKHFFSNDPRVNGVLNRFASICAADAIWVSIEADGLTKNRFGDRFSDVLELALTIARDNCIETTSPKERFIRLRSREIHKQVFLKIEYACESGYLREFDKNTVKLYDSVEQVDGYVRINLEKGYGCIKIAVSK